ncbi:MAG TPA: tetratricopeptide repeat protein [Puia sp.]|jgi:Tfp pilus assembly protein PilF|nr:tetratricopeptide repeat protein [Puia sp.]
MYKICFFCWTVMLIGPAVYSQTTAADTKTPQETARAYTRQGDYTNALVVLNEALKKDPQNLELSKDIAFNYYLEKEYDKGITVAKGIVERSDADVTSYQILAMLYKAIGEVKECDRLYKAGIKRFPRSGVLLNEYGEMLWSKQDYAAIKYWEEGIRIDPSYSGNYYNAARYYFFTQDKVWGLIYGEIFLNLESYTKRTAEIKDLLLEGYKKLFTDVNMQKNQDVKSPFVVAYLDVMGKLSFTISQGITAESLTVLRTKFIINWFQTYPTNYPFHLFDYERQLLKDGMFDAYNQWLFGAAGNLTAFQAWTTAHSDEYTRFTDFQKGRVFRMPEGQYYQEPK